MLTTCAWEQHAVSAVYHYPLDNLEMTFLTRDEHWSYSVVTSSRDVHGNTVRGAIRRSRSELSNT